ncbi:MAG TPA: BrnT family toxin [Pyrinomonadaceae bacterium]|nr:BrnT family toxin [Pyrinomonadaceae bacterium]
MRFEWDDEKAVANLEKHGVSFGEATEVFYDPNALEGFDAEHSAEENRFFIIGLSSRRLLYVVYAERAGDTVRIISARRAVKREEELYG